MKLTEIKMRKWFRKILILVLNKNFSIVNFLLSKNTQNWKFPLEKIKYSANFLLDNKLQDFVFFGTPFLLLHI